MRKVVCINDKKQPEGGELIKNKEYEIEKEFINNYDQKVFLILGINNQGITKLGMRWYGYDANRFADLEALVVENYEHIYAEN